MLVCLMLVVASMAEPEAEASADPQYYSKYEPDYNPSYYKPAYKPDYYKPEYPEPYPKPAYSQPYAKPAYKPSYGHSYKKDDYYCDPRTPPKCANASAPYCLSDYEYPLEEIQVI